MPGRKICFYFLENVWLDVGKCLVGCRKICFYFRKCLVGCRKIYLYLENVWLDVGGG